MNIVIQQGRVICPKLGFDQVTDVYIQSGKIVGLKEPDAPFVPDTILKAENCLVIPGLVDNYAHLKNQHGEINPSEVLSAARGGITTAFCAPVGQAPTDTPRRAKKIVEQDSPIQIKPIGALTEGLMGQAMSDLTALKEAGCDIFTQGLAPFKDLNVARNCYHYAASFNLKVVIFAQEHSLSSGYIHEGIVSAATGLSGIPYTAETISLAQHLCLIEETGVEAHFSHITTTQGLDMIRQAQNKGLAVSADCTMNHLHLSEIDVATMDPNTYVIPPLRSTLDQTALLKALNDGVLSTIVSSHKAINKIHKHNPFSHTTPGIAGLDTLLSLGLHLVNQRKLNLTTLIHALTMGPLTAYQQPFEGFETGAQANVCIVDPNAEWTVSEATLSSGINSPYVDWTLPGKIKATINQGEIIYPRS